MSLSVTFKTTPPAACPGTTTRHVARHILGPLAATARAIGKIVLAAHTRRAERELARYLERSGGKLTDDVERRMMQSLTRSNLRGW